MCHLIDSYIGAFEGQERLSPREYKKCLEYIIVHEMLHLRERHHNDTFLSYMDPYLPNWKHLKAKLNRLPVNHVDWTY